MLAVAATPAAASGSVRPPNARTPLGNERLSNERTVTRWANPFQVAAIWRAPTQGEPACGPAAAVHGGRLSRGLLGALSSRRDARDRLWLKVRIPGRPNGRKGWVRSTVLGPLHVVRTALLIDTRRSRAVLRRDGRRIWHAPVGHGAPGMRTPWNETSPDRRNRIGARSVGLYPLRSTIPTAFRGVKSQAAVTRRPVERICGRA